MLCIAFITNVTGQNVGIGTTTPMEKLDINGNINISGDIKINQQAGTPGQFITKSASNQLEWGSPTTGYKNNFVILDTGGNTFIVPNGVTELLVELWGAGGGGSSSSNPSGATNQFAGSGGGGGGYIKALLSVSSGQTITYYVGKGGGLFEDTYNNSQHYLGKNGDSTIVIISGYTLIAKGGTGPKRYGNVHLEIPGEGGGFKGPSTMNGVIKNYIGTFGQNGTISAYRYGYSGAITYGYVNYGDGGNGANTINTAGQGLKTSIWNGGNTSSLQVSPKQPGGGGAGTAYSWDFYDIKPLSGAAGMIVFWW